MKKVLIGILTGVLLVSSPVSAKEEIEQLYAQSAVLMDADNGRVLFEKNGSEKKPMASTTKIMTCILALEEGNLTDVVNVSENAARQPKVHLGMQMDEKFYLRDLLYSLMLESHNDSAVAIAEHIGGSVQAFADKMNAKAKEIGCRDTYFITPNGLDASDDNGEHSTTAEDLARIMSYCILKSPKKESFLSITQKGSYHFMDVDCHRSFSCQNHNAFLTMMDGALSGKTGFTGKAGYCYVGALESRGRTFVVALLGCGWPNNKSWKWHDARLLYEYGLEHYDRRDIREERILPDVRVKNGQRDSAGLECREETIELLLSREDEIKVEWDVPKSLTAPVVKGEQVGRVAYFVNGELYREFPVTSTENVPEITYFYCIIRIIRNIFL